MKKWLGVLLLIGSCALVIAARLWLGPGDRCVHDALPNIKGTFADCEARNPEETRSVP